MSEVKQIIVMRKDLNMRKGKIAAQASHASLGALLQLFNKTDNGDTINYSIDFGKDSYLNEWLNGIPTNTCIGIGPFWSKDIDVYTKHLKLL